MKTELQSVRFRQRYGPWALVAGASEGLGAAFAESLAARGLNLVLLARRAALLDHLAAALEDKYHVEVRPVALDLARDDLLDAVREATAGLEVGLLVYNAALAPKGPFLQQPLSDKLRALDVNCRGPLLLAHELGQGMAARGRGGIVLMTSLAGSQGAPWLATYGATKAFNLVLAEGLWAELRDSGVDVLACRAGATRTPGYLSSSQGEDFGVLDPEVVVEQALGALGRGPSVVPGWRNRLASFVLLRLFPRSLAVRMLGAATRRYKT